MKIQFFLHRAQDHMLDAILFKDYENWNDPMPKTFTVEGKTYAYESGGCDQHFYREVIEA